MAVVFVVKDVQPVSVLTLLANFVMRVADDWESQLPGIFCFYRQTVGFTGDAKDLTSSGLYLIDHS